MAHTYHLYISDSADKALKQIGVTPSEALRLGISILSTKDKMEIMNQETAINYLELLFQLLDTKTRIINELTKEAKNDRGNETAQDTTTS